ncbi:MAG: transpeptidase family protein [Bacteroidales bacterium]|nr:transpeptidase family protein [Bacteroidales bacterium]
MTEPGKKIIGRFAIVYILIVMFMGVIVYNILKIQTVERDNWLELGKKNDKKDFIVRPNRGNIYSADGQLMASSIPTYYVYMDTRVPALHVKEGRLFYENVDSLAESLANYFKDKSKAAYKRDIIKAYNQKKGEYQFYKGRISYAQLKDIKKFPLFRLGRNRSGLLTKEMFRRVKPYTTLASRTIGDIYADETKGGKNGLELGFEEYLKGTPGVSARKKVANRWQEVVQVEPIDGMDIISTIDVDMQDIAEKALLEKLKEIEAQTGYAIVMEVKTGEIKAIVNMDRNRDGSYSERRNGAVSDRVEPGSTFKTVSLMAVLDDGKAKLTDVIATGNGLYRFGPATMRDHNAHRGGYGDITLEQALNASSNVGISRTVVNAYGKNPGKFVEKLYKMGMNEPFELHIPGTAKPWIRHPNDKSVYWSATTLPWMSIGYEVQVAPIYTLAFYNAIANNGRFLEPLLVKSINQNGIVVKEFTARVINEQMCKPSTVKDVQKALLGVVESPKYGTGKIVHSPHVRIAGKTGTAQISKGSAGYTAGGKSHQVSFCGFFPYEDPKYTCIVVIREPRIGYPSGGAMSGVVVKNIAERITSIDTTSTIIDFKNDSTLKFTAKEPSLKPGKSAAIQTVMNTLNHPVTVPAEEWVRVKEENKSVQLEPIEVEDRVIPNLRGMGAKDAVFLCEEAGLRVNFSGIGKVVSQSIPAGTKVKKGQTIALVLAH